MIVSVHMVAVANAYLDDFLCLRCTDTVAPQPNQPFVDVVDNESPHSAAIDIAVDIR
jgi:hypothetical protein